MLLTGFKKNDFKIVFRLQYIICCVVLFPCNSTSKELPVKENIDLQTARQWYMYADELLNIGSDSVPYYYEKLQEFGRINNHAEITVKGKLLNANYEWRAGNYEQAMEIAMDALQDAEQNAITEHIPSLYSTIGNLHKENENYNLALKAADMGIEAARKINDTVWLIILMRNKAMFTHSFGMLKNDADIRKQGLDYYMEGLAIAESDDKFEELRTSYYNNISQYYKISRNDALAMQYGKKAQQLAEKYNQQRSLTYTYNWLGELYFRKGDEKRGIEYLQKALNITYDINTPFRTAELYAALYQCYRKMGQPEKALVYYKRAIDMRDSLQVMKNVQQIGKLQIEYETEKKEQRIESLRLINIEKTRRANLILAGMALLLILLVFLFYQYRTIRQRNKLLAAHNAKINEQSLQLQFLMKELHHRVKNNLQIVSSLLNLQSTHLTHKDAQQAINIGRQRIEAMSLIHKSLYKQDNPNMVNMQEYIPQLVDSIIQCFSVDPGKLTLDLDIQVDTLDVDTALPLGLIINEWITNAFKHAYSQVPEPLLSVSLEKKDGLKLEIMDNGPGMNKDVWEQPKDSFGIKLIKVLSKQLKGSCNMVATNGTKLILQIP